MSEVAILKKKLLSLRVKKSSGDLKNTSEIKKTKKEVAKILTAKNKKEGK